MKLDRSVDVWSAFIGMFGGDAVERKYGETAPPEWRAALNRLDDFQIDKGLRRLLFSGKSTVPSLPEFVRLCRAIGSEDREDGDNLRRLPPPEIPWEGDEWDVRANTLLLAYVLRKAGKRVYFDAPQTRILVKYKRAWAQDMREAPLPPEERERAWRGCMERAESEVHSGQQ